MVHFFLSESQYTAYEGDSALPVTIERSGSLRLANPIILFLSPLTISDALNRDIISNDSIEEENPRAPNRAGESYDNNVILPSYVFKVVVTAYKYTKSHYATSVNKPHVYLHTYVSSF